LEKLGLNQRQIAAVVYTTEAGRITNREYQARWSVSKPTAARELVDLMEKGLLIRHGQTGKNTFYTVGSPNISNVS
jgi:ATP-dependent DNA helicase RecG